MTEKRILVTAFCETSSELLVKNAEFGTQYQVLYLPNDKVKDFELLINALKQGQFDYVISLGQRPNIKDKVHIETRARKGEMCLETGFDCVKLKEMFEQSGLSAKLSDNAGTSFCNELYWNGMQYIEESQLDTKMVFVHVPFEKNISDVDDFRRKLLGGVAVHKYKRIIYWSETDQKFIVEVPELAGCMADGRTPAEALENAEAIISEWIETTKEIGREIPAYDCGFQKENNWFRYRAAAIIVEDGCVLFAGNDVDDYYYSVGGGVHMNETAEEAVVREVQEETGVTYEVERLAVIHENFFENPGGTLGNIKGHEVAFYFLMKSRGTKELHGNSVTCGNIKESMHWIPIEDLDKVRAFPTFLKDYLKKEHKEIVHIVTHEEV